MDINKTTLIIILVIIITILTYIYYPHNNIHSNDNIYYNYSYDIIKYKNELLKVYGDYYDAVEDVLDIIVYNDIYYVEDSVEFKIFKRYDDNKYKLDSLLKLEQ